MIIDIKTVPHETQRYNTVGDWLFNPDNSRLTIRVSAMGDCYKETLVAVHEVVEAVLCLKRGIAEKDVSIFDMCFEAARKEGDFSEPGDHPDAPYKKEHFFATSIERLLAAELGIDWREYDDAIQAL